MAASAAAYVLEINTYPFINAFGQAVTTFTSQNFGAGNIKRCLNVSEKRPDAELWLYLLFDGACLFGLRGPFWRSLA